MASPSAQRGPERAHVLQLLPPTVRTVHTATPPALATCTHLYYAFANAAAAAAPPEVHHVYVRLVHAAHDAHLGVHAPRNSSEDAGNFNPVPWSNCIYQVVEGKERYAV